MPRVSTHPWDSETTSSQSLTMAELSMASGFAVVNDVPNETVVKNVSSPVDLEELIAYKYSKIEKINSPAKGVYPMTTRNGYQISVKDDYIQRTVEPDGVTIHDDPVTVYLTFRTTSGNNIVSGTDVLQAVMRAISALTLQSGTTVSSTPIDRLMRGATKPSVLV